MAWAAIVAASLVSPGCGSGESAPAAPTAAATPEPTASPLPPPRLTASLDAEADLTQYSPPMARLTSPQAFEIAITPFRINPPFTSQFAHSFDVWLSLSNEVSASSSLGFAMIWLGNNRWAVSSYSPAGGWYHAPARFTLPLGQTATVRVTKHAQGIAELFVNGVSMHSIEDATPSRFESKAAPAMTQSMLTKAMRKRLWPQDPPETRTK